MTSSWFLGQGLLHAILHDEFWKSNHDFLIAFPSNVLSVMHGFWRHRDFSARGRFTLFNVTDHLQRGSVKDGLGSLWQHGNFNTSQLRNLSSYNVETVHVWLRPWDENMCQVWLESARHGWNIHFLWLSFLTSFFFLRTCTAQTDRDNFTHNDSKDAVWRKEGPSQQVFFLICRFGGHFAQTKPKFRPPPVENFQPNAKSRITSKPFKI